MDLIKRVARRVIRYSTKETVPKPLILNEAVNFEKRAIFIAVPKTGTTSVRVQIKQAGRPLIVNQHLNILQIRDSIYLYLLMEALGKNTSFPSESIPQDMELREKSQQIFKSFFKFSAVRNPWARAVSLYFRREGVQVSDHMTFEEFCEDHFYASDTCRHPTLHKNQYDWHCDEDGNFLMDYVYQIEDFAAAIDEIAQRTDGRIQLTHIKKNVNPSSRAIAYRDLYSARTKKLIANRFEKDIDYYKYSF